MTMKKDKNATVVRAVKGKKTRDLPPRKSGAIKGGRLAANDNITLVQTKVSFEVRNQRHLPPA